MSLLRLCFIQFFQSIFPDWKSIEKHLFARYSTVTTFAKLRGLSGLIPRKIAK